MRQLALYISIPQYLIQQGLKALAEGRESFSEIFTFNKIAEAEGRLKVPKPAILIFDYLDEESISDQVWNWVRNNPQLKVLVITDDVDKGRVRSVLKMGVQGFLTKSCSEAEILEALNAIQLDQTFYCNRVLKALVKTDNQLELSEREMEVVKLIATGHSSSEIAETLVISIHTVNSHRKNILKKLKLKSPTELIIFAVEQGWVSLDRK